MKCIDAFLRARLDDLTVHLYLVFDLHLLDHRRKLPVEMGRYILSALHFIKRSLRAQGKAKQTKK